MVNIGLAVLKSSAVKALTLSLHDDEGPASPISA